MRWYEILGGSGAFLTLIVLGLPAMVGDHPSSLMLQIFFRGGLLGLTAFLIYCWHKGALPPEQSLAEKSAGISAGKKSIVEANENRFHLPIGATAISVGDNSRLIANRNDIRFGEQPYPEPTGEYRNLTNLELKNETRRFVQYLRDKQAERSASRSHMEMNERIRAHERDNPEFNTGDGRTSLSLSSELFSRIGQIELPEGNVDQGRTLVEFQQLAGPRPLNDVAEFIEYLANLLP